MQSILNNYLLFGTHFIHHLTQAWKHDNSEDEDKQRQKKWFADKYIFQTHG